ncbi:MAG: DegT/DnrJ/EryC1/StrS family aminotransferase [Candidatus Latescibacteria bacterium]|jgi:dTDP-4-amino-4,6-dideoxygalactose transaminase|nr:DegT/DnrJ/EryC1/StrS family aminotransferase [Candidatus Latescibacterota bacterium]
MTEAQRRELLDGNKPERVFHGEPQLGAWYTEEEVEAAVKAIRDSMDWHVGFGFIVDEIVEFEKAFARYCGTKFAVSLCTASVGLDLAMVCLDLEPDDEVICPALNFPASPLSILGQGARLVLCEVDRRTFNCDPEDVERRITPRTRAIYPVHMNGLSAPMDDLLDIAERHPHPKHGPLKVIGDAARACGGGYKGTKIGKKGWMNVFSLHTMKLMTTLGEGGLVTTDDAELAKRLRSVRQWGGETQSWGTSYKLTKVQAAVGSVQIRRLDEMIALRRQRAYERLALLEGIPEVTPPYEPPDSEHTFYLFTLLVPEDWTGEKRDRLCTMLRDDYGVGTCIANPPVWQGRPFIEKHTQGQPETLPVSVGLGRRLFCVSLHPQMTEEQNAYVAAALWESVERVRKE